MSKTPFNLEPNEQPIDNWALWYHSPQKKAYEGKLCVTNKRIFFMDNDKEINLDLRKDQVTGVQEKKSLMSKTAEVTMNDGSVHGFDRGMMSVEKVIAAINLRG